MIVKAVQGTRNIKLGRICWKGRFWAWSERVKEWWMGRVVMMTEMSWQVNEEVSRDMTGEANWMNLMGQAMSAGCIHQCVWPLSFSRNWRASSSVLYTSENTELRLECNTLLLYEEAHDKCDLYYVTRDFCCLYRPYKAPCWSRSLYFIIIIITRNSSVDEIRECYRLNHAIVV